jgi:tRNA nucleotidyltransferase (CCA-adding enzyme)
MDFPTFREEFARNLLSNKPSLQIKRWLKAGWLNKYLKQLARCDDIAQDTRYHQDNVFMHCIKTCDNTPAILSLRWAGLLHDVGKYKAFNQQNSHGKITFYRHELFSRDIAERVLKKYNADLELQKEVVALVAGHMYYYTSEWSDHAVRKFVKLHQLTLVQLNNWESIPLFQLRVADRLSRNLKPITRKQLDFIDRLRSYIEANQNI